MSANNVVGQHAQFYLSIDAVPSKKISNDQAWQPFINAVKMLIMSFDSFP